MEVSVKTVDLWTNQKDRVQAPLAHAAFRLARKAWTQVKAAKESAIAAISQGMGDSQRRKRKNPKAPADIAASAAARRGRFKKSAMTTGTTRVQTENS